MLVADDRDYRIDMEDFHQFVEKKKKLGYSVAALCTMMHVKRKRYYRWKNGKKKREERKHRETEDLRMLCGCFREIIRKVSFIPGKRTFKDHMWRDYNINIGVNRCRKIMKYMRLVPTRPKKDAYKGQATYNHVCASAPNYVEQEFRISPRFIVTTDITYLYYGPGRTVCYLCIFKDAFTTEILGYAVRSTMDVGLIKAAYDMMMNRHGDEIRHGTCFIHSDQGSQYTSTTFRELLENDKIIQSVSARGVSQDNSPAETFFSRLKNEAIYTIARCRTLASVQRLIDGFMHYYNDIRYQHTLAGLAPSEFYLYVKTGIYPLDSYYGMKATELMTIEELVAAKLKLIEEKRERKRKNTREKATEDGKLKDPRMIVLRDQQIIHKELEKWKEAKENAVNQIKKLKEILEKSKTAAKFLKSCSAEVIEALKTPYNWRNYPELAYVFDFDDIF